MKLLMLKVRTGIAIFIFLISVLVSCKKSDKTPEVDSSVSVAGEWKMSDLMLVNNSTGKPRNINELVTLNYPGFLLQQNGHWLAPGKAGGTWMADGNNLFVNFENGDRISLTIYKTNSSLIMEQLYDQEGELAGGTIYYVFSKQ